MDFFYPNFINDHWRIEGQIWFGDKNHFVDNERKCFKMNEVMAFLSEKGIALFDTAMAVNRLKDNASDAFLEIVEHTDIEALLKKIPLCHTIATTGEKATGAVCQTMGIPRMPAVGEALAIPGTCLELYRLPSSSRAYPLSLERKAEAYERMFRRYGLV